MHEIPPGLSALTDYKQFIIWTKRHKTLYTCEGKNYSYEDLVKSGWTDELLQSLPQVKKTDKLPIDPNTLKYRNAHDPRIHMDATTALSMSAMLGTEYYVGFTFTKNDPFFFVDVDACADSSQANGWSERANELMGRLAGASVEVSQSGKGLHIIGTAGELPSRKCKYEKEFDLYTEKRFVALTGERVIGDAAHDCTPALVDIVETYLARSKDDDGYGGLRSEPVPEWNGITDDTELIERACTSASLLSSVTGKAAFKDLWERNVDALMRSYPHDQGLKDFDESAVDMALAQHLAFWTGKHGTRIEKLMRESALHRDKWDSRPEYVPNTIQAACAMQKDVHSKTPRQEPLPEGGAVPDNVEITTGFQFMSATQQLKHFAGCVYVMDQDKILTPWGDMLKQSQFRVMFGGYVFDMDGANKKTTRSAWEAFTESQIIRHPKVHSSIFRPLLPAGNIYMERNGIKKVNSFSPEYGESIPGDVTPFLNHIEKLIPDVGDRNILLSYLAACVQLPGHKFQWCVLLQGLQGNGKTILTKPLEYALGGKHSVQVNAKDVANVFNSWVERKLIAVVEEIRVAGKYDISEALKPLITNSRIGIQPKGGEQRSGDNSANFIMFSNHKDAVMKTVEDRRYCVFYTAQQTIEDLHRDGMDDSYFEKLHSYFDGGGSAYVADYLRKYPISVRVKGRAPVTTSTAAAHIESLGPAEQILMEAIDLEKHGFREGLTTTTNASNELAGRGRQMSPQAVGHVMRNVGYVIPAALERAEGKIQINGARFRMYAIKNSPMALETSQDVLRKSWIENNC